MADELSSRARRLVPARWLDARAVVGVVMVLGSVVIGARLFAAGEATTKVWTAAHDLSPGERVDGGDLTATRIHLPEHARHYLGGAVPAGYEVTRVVRAGELVPVGALRVAGTASTRWVTVPVAAGHLPPGTAAGSRVDVYVTARPSSSSGQAKAPTLVLAGATVQSRPSSGHGFGADATEPVVLVVPADSVADVVGAVEAGAIDLVALPPDAGEEP